MRPSIRAGATLVGAVVGAGGIFLVVLDAVPVANNDRFVFDALIALFGATIAAGSALLLAPILVGVLGAFRPWPRVSGVLISTAALAGAIGGAALCEYVLAVDPRFLFAPGYVAGGLLAILGCARAWGDEAERRPGPAAE